MKHASILLFFILVCFGLNAQSVYKTPSGKKYHLGSCRMVDNVSQKLTLAQAIALKLGPCKICNPGTGQKQHLAATEQTPQGENNATTQCKGTTKKGTRCQHRTRIGNGYCFQHQPQ